MIFRVLTNLIFRFLTCHFYSSLPLSFNWWVFFLMSASSIYHNYMVSSSWRRPRHARFTDLRLPPTFVFCDIQITCLAWSRGFKQLAHWDTYHQTALSFALRNIPVAGWVSSGICGLQCVCQITIIRQHLWSTSYNPQLRTAWESIPSPPYGKQAC